MLNIGTNTVGWVLLQQYHNLSTLACCVVHRGTSFLYIQRDERRLLLWNTRYRRRGKDTTTLHTVHRSVVSRYNATQEIPR